MPSIKGAALLTLAIGTNQQIGKTSEYVLPLYGNCATITWNDASDVRCNSIAVDEPLRHFARASICEMPQSARFDLRVLFGEPRSALVESIIRSRSH